MSPHETGDKAPEQHPAVVLVVRLVAAAALFLLASASPRLLAGAGLIDPANGPAWLPHFLVKSVLIVAAIAAVLFERGGLATLGLRRSNPPVRWLRVLLPGLILGGAATAAVLFSPAAGMQQLFEGWPLPAVVLTVWFYSSVSEELFVRGWFQGAVMGRAGGWRAGGGHLSAPVAASALLFGALHLSLLFKGIDLWTTAIIVTAATVLGYLAATLRERHQGLLPSIAIHVAFNLGGAAAAIVITIVRTALAGGPDH